MHMTNDPLWERFKAWYLDCPDLGLALDISRMNFPDDFFDSMAPAFEKAIREMTSLEAGVIANPDENRMVGHYWLRTPSLAPTSEIRNQIEQTQRDIWSFAGEVHAGRVCGQGGPFENYLLIGIGGSALGPQFIADALGHPGTDKLRAFFLDNTDPDGFDRVLATIGKRLDRTLCLVVSKSGGTKETRNGMLEVKSAYQQLGLSFEAHAVAVTGEGSALDKLAATEKWVKRFPMWDWVGGRTSIMSAVGLLPAALQGIDLKMLLAGASQADTRTRSKILGQNPSALLALMWYYAGAGRGAKDMVVLPYKDRLCLFSKYLQQLVMESLGKELNLASQRVNQGISVFGNKGSTDQHSYIQQLADGLNNFFAIFIEVKRARDGASALVEADANSADYLHSFLYGTRRALHSKNRESITIKIDEVTPMTVGALIAIFERAVGFYASFVGINAYHQPGVEAGKKAADSLIQLKSKIIAVLNEQSGLPVPLEQLAAKISVPPDTESVFTICEYLCANPGTHVQCTRGKAFFDRSYSISN